MPQGRAARRQGSSRPPAELALVSWVDAAYQDGPDLTDDIAGCVTLLTGGLLVRDTPESVTLALDRCDERRTWRHITTIPRACILWVKTVRA